MLWTKQTLRIINFCVYFTSLMILILFPASFTNEIHASCHALSVILEHELLIMSIPYFLLKLIEFSVAIFLTPLLMYLNNVSTGAKVGQ